MRVGDDGRFAYAVYSILFYAQNGDWEGSEIDT